MKNKELCQLTFHTVKLLRDTNQVIDHDQLFLTFQVLST